MPLRFTRHFFSKQHLDIKMVAAALSGLLVLILSVQVYTAYKNSDMNTIIHRYGDDLSQLAAEQAISGTLNNDAISLQAVAQRITDNTLVNSIIIYNISNIILAQANSDISDAEQVSSHRYTAPILSSNNIIGSVTIGISRRAVSDTVDVRSTNPTSTQLIGLLALCLLGLLALGIYLRIKTNKEYPANTDPTTDQIPQKTVAATPPDETHEQDAPVILLTLSISNSSLLYQQLNSELRALQFQQLGSHIKKVLSLYNGQHLLTTDKHIILQFQSNQQDTLLKAIYSSILIIGLQDHSNDSMIQLKGLIQEVSFKPLAHELTLNEQIDERRKHEQRSQHHTETDSSHTGVWISAGLIQKYALSNKVISGDNHDNDSDEHSYIVSINGLQGQAKNLLDNQLKQLTQT